MLICDWICGLWGCGGCGVGCCVGFWFWGLLFNSVAVRNSLLVCVVWRCCCCWLVCCLLLCLG